MDRLYATEEREGGARGRRWRDGNREEGVECVFARRVGNGEADDDVWLVGGADAGGRREGVIFGESAAAALLRRRAGLAYEEAAGFSLAKLGAFEVQGRNAWVLGGNAVAAAFSPLSLVNVKSALSLVKPGNDGSAQSCPVAFVRQ